MFAEIKASQFQKIRDRLLESGISYQTSSASFTGEKVQYLHLEFGDLTKEELGVLKGIFKEIIEDKDTFKKSAQKREEEKLSKKPSENSGTGTPFETFEDDEEQSNITLL